jgi:hypothetical protein
MSLSTPSLSATYSVGARADFICGAEPVFSFKPRGSHAQIRHWAFVF